MISRLYRVIGSLVIVVAAYWTYALAAVPLIEPPADEPRANARATEDEVARGREAPARQRAGFDVWFQPGDWELGTPRPKVLDTTRGMLLLRDYTPLPDGRIKIEPCTLILLPSDSNDDHTSNDNTNRDDETRRRKAVIMRAAEGAIFQLDKPLGEGGRPVAGELTGPVTIRSDRDDPGPADDLEIDTSNVVLRDDLVTTDEAVRFRLGSNRGRGQGLRLRLLRKAGTAPSDFDFDGLQSVRLERNVQLHVELGDAELVPEGLTQGRTVAAAPADARARSAPDGAPQPPVEVRCQGPFEFDLLGYVATFRDHVDVVRVYPMGPADQLNCQLLSIFFAQADDDAAATHGGRLPKLEAQRLEAQGNPVTIRSPRSGVQATGSVLTYNLKTGRADLVGSPEASVSRPDERIVAGRLIYERGEPDTIGRFVASGPGNLVGKMPDGSPGSFTASWSEQLQFYPHDQLPGVQVISTIGDADVSFGDAQRLRAGEIHVELEESARDTLGSPDPDTQRRNLAIKRMTALDDVRVDAGGLHAHVGKLQAWFEEPAQPQRPAMAAAQPRGSQPVSPGAPPSAPAAGPPPPGELASTTAFDVAGGLLQVQFVLTGKQVDVAKLTLRRLTVDEHDQLRQPGPPGPVKLVELQPEPGRQPFSLVGDYLHLDRPQPLEEIVDVTGGPAVVDGRDMNLTGGTIHLDRGRGLLTIETPGSMQLPVDRDLEGRTLAQPERMHVDWDERMQFDGRRARFQGQVNGQLGMRQLHTDQMDVLLVEHVDFAEPSRGEKPRLERIECHNGVVLESQTVDRRGRTSIERLSASDLRLDQLTGAVEALGPGRLRTVRPGSAGLLAPMPGGRPPADEEPSLAYLDVRFRDSILGNMQLREMTFRGDVQAIYGPVPSWEHEVHEDRLGPSDVYITCDEIQLTQMPTDVPDVQALELVAHGNTYVEGQQFTARGERMSYTQAKDLLVLEGDGRSNAELFRQERVGGTPQRTEAQRIWFWRREQRVRIDGAQALEGVGMVDRDRE